MWREAKTPAARWRTIDLRSGSSKEVALTLPAGAGANGLRLVAFLEDPGSGHILGAAVQKL